MELNNIKIFYINLKYSEKRRDFMENQFKKLGIYTYIRYEAIDGKEIKKDKIDNIYNILKKNNLHYTLPTLGEIGIFYSTINLWNKIKNLKEDYFLILEDDVIINSRLIEDLDYIINNISKNEIVKLDGRKGFFNIDTKKCHDIILKRYITPPLGMTGYIIGKDAAKRLSDIYTDYIVPVDNILQQVYKHKINIWCSNIRYIKHNDKNLGGSTIQKQNKKSLKDKIRREILRPIYRLKTHIRNFMGYIK